MTDDTPDSKGRAQGGDHSPDIDGFAEEFERQWDAATDREPGSSALDPALWQRIRNGASDPKRGRARARRKASVEAARGERPSRESHRVPGVPPSVPSSQWHRGLLVFAVVVLVGCVVLLVPGGRIEPRYGAIVREAPQVVTPEPGQEVGCGVAPLTSEDVLAIVLDPEGRGVIDERALFATPPPTSWEYPHSETWLPEANGSVDTAGGQRDVRVPTAAEFRGAKGALDRYLRCQYEGTNYQLWALESPVEVQRQILTFTLSPDERGWPLEEPEALENLTETQILETIERLGPKSRQEGYMSFVWYDGVIVEPNPETTDAYVADNPDSGEVEYAWIATEWTDPATGDVVSTRGAALEATPSAATDGSMPNLMVMILTFDADRDEWLVEWFVPTI